MKNCNWKDHRWLRTLPAFEVDKAGCRRWPRPWLRPHGVDFELLGRGSEERRCVDLVEGRQGHDPSGGRLAPRDSLTSRTPTCSPSRSRRVTLRSVTLNLGKLVIAVCDSAGIVTTTGTVVFDGDKRTHSKAKRESGSVFTGVTPDDLRRVPAGHRGRVHADPARTYRDDVQRSAPLQRSRSCVHRAPQTEISDDEAACAGRSARAPSRSTRHAATELLYEMGIPVVPTGDQWHVSIEQKVPLNVDRDNVTPAFLRDVRRAVLDHHLLLNEDAGAKWIDDALADEGGRTVEAAMTAGLGEKRVAHDRRITRPTRSPCLAGYRGAEPGAQQGRMEGCAGRWGAHTRRAGNSSAREIDGSETSAQRSRPTSGRTAW